MSNIYPRETVEFLAVTVTVDGSVVVVGVKFCVTSPTDRPVTFVTATSLNSKIGIMISGYAPGDYKVWAQITSAPEIPVIDCGSFRVT